MSKKETTLEQGSGIDSAIESRALAVTQPEKLQGLLDTIDLMDRVAESLGEDRSGDLGAGGTAQGGQGDDSAQSARATAIANLPEEKIMQQKLELHIRKEVKVLRKDVRKATRDLGKPGSAYKLNELYARIRRLNNLLSELFDAGYEVVKRLYIRIFIDKQTVF